VTTLTETSAVERISAAVHERWMQSKHEQGVTSRKSETGEELMVPYNELSEAAKSLDRGTVEAVLAALPVGIKHVLEERARQDELHGVHDYWEPVWFTILGEEFGEVAKAVESTTFAEGLVAQDNHRSKIREELVQLAAVCVAWIERMDSKA